MPTCKILITTFNIKYLVLNPEGFNTHHLLYSGCEDETNYYLLKIRDNICYFPKSWTPMPHALTAAASGITLSTWRPNCATTDRKVYSKKVLSISDEAFILLCLINYRKWWFA